MSGFAHLKEFRGFEYQTFLKVMIDMLNTEFVFEKKGQYNFMKNLVLESPQLYEFSVYEVTQKLFYSVTLMMYATLPSDGTDLLLLIVNAQIYLENCISFFPYR